MVDETAHDEGAHPADQLVGRFYAWWDGDPPPGEPAISVEPFDDDALVAEATGMDRAEVAARLAGGHRPWLARIDGAVAGWGWVATREAAISELGIEIVLRPHERYLWDFVTLPEWRDRGVYTALLQGILCRGGGERYWIGHDEGNTASARGVEKVGFRQVGTARIHDGRVVFVPDGPPDRAKAAATLLDLPVIDG